uniref:DUF4585 domain-containing protein n=1 Tax=Poecilia formosa TaxID=48698 RepID=A0A096LT87_POEFO
KSSGHRKHSDGGFSDTSSGGSFLDETDREVSNLTDRAFRSLCIGDEAVYNDSDLSLSSPSTYSDRQLAFCRYREEREREDRKRAAQENFNFSVQQYGQDWTQGMVSATFQHSLVETSQLGKSLREEELSFHSNGATELSSQQRRSHSRVSSLIRAFNSDGHRDGAGAEDNIRERDDGTSWDKSALMSIQRELSEFSYQQNFNHHFHPAGPFSCRDPNFYSSEAEAVAQMSHSYMRSSQTKHIMSAQANCNSNFFIHSEFSPFQLWRDYNRFPFRQAEVSGFMHYSEFPKWYQTPMYNELSLENQAHGRHRDIRQSRNHLEYQVPLTAPRSISTSSQIQRASAVEKRCESELAVHHPHRKWTQSLGTNKLPPHRPSTASPSTEMSRRVRDTIGSVKALQQKVKMMSEYDTSNQQETFSRIGNQLTPSVQQHQDVDTSRLHQHEVSPQPVEHPPVRAESRGATPDVRMSSYRSRATSLLFNLKDNRKRVKSTYSPTKFKGLDTAERNQQPHGQEPHETAFTSSDVQCLQPEAPRSTNAAINQYHTPGLSLTAQTSHPTRVNTENKHNYKNVSSSQDDWRQANVQDTENIHLKTNVPPVKHETMSLVECLKQENLHGGEKEQVKDANLEQNYNRFTDQQPAFETVKMQELHNIRQVKDDHIIKVEGRKNEQKEKSRDTYFQQEEEKQMKGEKERVLKLTDEPTNVTEKVPKKLKTEQAEKEKLKEEHIKTELAKTEAPEQPSLQQHSRPDRNRTESNKEVPKKHETTVSNKITAKHQLEPSGVQKEPGTENSSQEEAEILVKARDSKESPCVIEISAENADLHLNDYATNAELQKKRQPEAGSVPSKDLAKTQPVLHQMDTTLEDTNDKPLATQRQEKTVKKLSDSLKASEKQSNANTTRESITAGDKKRTARDSQLEQREKGHEKQRQTAQQDKQRREVEEQQRRLSQEDKQMILSAEEQKRGELDEQERKAKHEEQQRRVAQKEQQQSDVEEHRKRLAQEKQQRIASLIEEQSSEKESVKQTQELNRIQQRNEVPMNESLVEEKKTASIKARDRQEMDKETAQKTDALQYFAITSTNRETRSREKQLSSASPLQQQTPTLPRSNTSSPAPGAKPLMFRVKDNTIRGSSLTKSVKPRFHKNFGEDFLMGSTFMSEDVESFATSASDLTEMHGPFDFDRPESACSFSSDVSRSLGKPPAVPPKSEKALRRAQRLTSRRMKKELSKAAEGNPVGVGKEVSSIPSSSSSSNEVCSSNHHAVASPHFSPPVAFALAPATGSSLPSFQSTNYPLTQRKVLQDLGSGQFFVVDVPVQVKTKTFFDPETGKYVQLNVRQTGQNISQPQ